MPLGIHLNRDVRAHSQEGHEQLVRVRPRIISADIAWFVRVECMRAYGYGPGVFQRSGTYGYVSGHNFRSPPVVLTLTCCPRTRTAKSYPDLSDELANHVAGFLRILVIAIGGS